MQQYNYNCQLSPEENRLLAEAELATQKWRISQLRTEYAEAIQRIQQARRMLAGVE